MKKYPPEMLSEKTKFHNENPHVKTVDPKYLNIPKATSETPEKSPKKSYKKK